MTLPSKEVLSAVLNAKVLEIRTLSGSELLLSVVKKGSVKMNIHEIVYECKEWINRREYVFHEDTKGYSKIRPMHPSADCATWEDEGINIKRVFDASEWILARENK